MVKVLYLEQPVCYDALMKKDAVDFGFLKPVCSS